MTYDQETVFIGLVIVSIVLAAEAAITLIGVFMWAGAWAAMAAFGFILVLVTLAVLVGWR